jgi:exopolyphosphatase / guanosine-5'-triphosphate,3'-diphosphate pyrophosphatase
MADSTQRLALISIGSNSVRLLISDGSEVIERDEVVTRLAGYERTSTGEKLLTNSAIRDTLDAVTGFARRAETLHADLEAIVATEAVRAASNREELMTPLHQELGLHVKIISGEEEAHLGWNAIASGYANTGSTLGVIDIGGGSTDISVGPPGASTPEAVRSIKLGSRTVTHLFGLDTPIDTEKLASVMAALRQELAPQVDLQPRPALAVVIGGTADVLASLSSYASGALYATQDSLIDKNWLQEWLDTISGLTLSERAAEGVPEDRTDVIVAGGAILLSLLDAWDLNEFYTSRRNILDGLLAR